MRLDFTVNEQTITAKYKSIPRVGSREYLRLAFRFGGSDWEGCEVFCYVGSGEYKTRIQVVDGLMDVPEYYTTQQQFTLFLVGFRGETIIPTNVLTVKLGESGECWEVAPPDPGDPAYQQIMATIGDVEQLRTTEKSSLVAAINELVGAGSVVTDAYVSSTGHLMLVLLDGSAIDAGYVVGTAATITVGVVTTLVAGAAATVSNTGTPSEAVLNFGIPVGASGYTPQRHVDYWTEDDIAEIRRYVDEAILGGEW